MFGRSKNSIYVLCYVYIFIYTGILVNVWPTSSPCQTEQKNTCATEAAHPQQRVALSWVGFPSWSWIRALMDSFQGGLHGNGKVVVFYGCFFTGFPRISENRCKLQHFHVSRRVILFEAIYSYIYIYSGCGFQIISFVELSWAENSTKIIQNRCDRLKGKYYYLIK